ncbi:ABC transporter permease [Aestuariivirga sp. YIM B02566]|uniref:ABC transporter permease n=1 Tax=Taklimakanibacter albus TaxID=2800327 RepID=A0ACC5RAH3_9HYPH|nr:ABC transporter permease [Aestuariivirga sp. YIM B02566]MBK1869613.1 ABC transporter permease [Aestuariivirga sp. YIM B02566]
MTAASYFTGSDEAGSAATLKDDERRERLAIAGLSLPALLLVAVCLIIPVGSLLALSFIGAQGNLSLENYQRLIDNKAYLAIFLTTFEISAVITLICMLLGYPLAYFITLLPPRAVGFAMLAIILPFWTSLLVRTYAWMVLLQKQGLVNSTLLKLGVIDEPIALLHNYAGTVIGMSHIMLPFLVLPLYGAMKAIDHDLIRAAANLGAGPIVRFWTVSFPLSLPGLGAGALIVFVLSLGFYVTPALLGGGKVTMVAMRIQKSVALYPNWGAASALAVVLLVVTALVLLLGLWIWRRNRGNRPVMS